MISRTMAAATLAALLVAPAAAAQITGQQQADTVRANQQGQTEQAQTPQGQMQRAQPMAAGTDSMPVDTAFLAHAVSGNIKEVRLGELAAKQASNAAVKEFAQQMVTAHRDAYKASRGIADSLNVGKLDSMMPEHRSTVERFRSMQGEAFDSAYMRLMVQEHAKEVATYRNQVQFGDQDMIRRYALQTLPVLRDHFDLAQRTARDIGVQVQTPLAGEMEAGPNDTTAYMTPGRDSAMPRNVNPVPGNMTPMPGDTAAMRDTTMMQRDTTLVPQADTSNVPGQNVPRQAGQPAAPPVKVEVDTTTRVDIEARTPIGRQTTDTLKAAPATRDSTP